MTPHEVRDGDRVLEFDGHVVAQSSSRTDGRPRWIEFTLYETSGGKYVLHRVGRTVVTGEVDRHFARVCETSQGVVETLYMVDNDGVRFLTPPAMQLLTAAGRHDPAFLRERVD